jgi:hypothetical protein
VDTPSGKETDMFERLRDSLVSATTTRVGPKVVCLLTEDALGDDEARTLFTMAGAPKDLWPVIRDARANGWFIDEEWMDRAVQINQVPGWVNVLGDAWFVLCAPTTSGLSDTTWVYMTPLVAHYLRRALAECTPEDAGWGHLLTLANEAIDLLEEGRAVGAQALSSVVLTTVTDRLDADYGSTGQRFGANVRRPRPTKSQPEGREFIREHSWVHITDDLLIIPAVNGQFDRNDPTWSDSDAYSRHASVHGADSAHQYRAANAARATAAATSVLYLITHPRTSDDIRTMIQQWVGTDD